MKKKENLCGNQKSSQDPYKLILRRITEKSVSGPLMITSLVLWSNRISTVYMDF